MYYGGVGVDGRAVYTSSAGWTVAVRLGRAPLCFCYAASAARVHSPRRNKPRAVPCTCTEYLHSYVCISYGVQSR